MRSKLPLWLLALSPSLLLAEPEKYDIVIYGGTSAGIVAGIQAKAMGKTVVVIEPTKRLGGLTTGGLGQTDIGNKQVIGGLSRQFYERIAKFYTQPTAWKWEKREEYKDSGQTRTAAGEASMWTFEPSAALSVFDAWIAETGVPVVTGERLDRSATGVTKDGARIVSIRMESGREFAGQVFMDTTYEGDLMAAAKVGYDIGRESRDTFGEDLNGVQTELSKNHNFEPGVDPYIVKGDPNSGLLPFLNPEGPGDEWEGDAKVQAYCFRMCLTDHPDNRIPFHKPEGYNEQWYELLLRNCEAGLKGMPWINSSMPNRKTDTNNRTGFSTDFIGENYQYPDASYAERDAIVAKHRLYQQGLMWTLANHPRVTEKIRTEVARWGMCKDEFTEGNGWQEQLYIREARRMMGAVVMTQSHCQRKTVAQDSIGMGAYNMDSHNVQRYVDANGHARNEGNIEVGVPPYPISYGAITPKAEECVNLLVPVCLSASHIAYGSIRMEPVFMILGQSAATAASLAIDAKSTVQAVDYAKLKERMVADGQILDYIAPPKPAANRTPLDSLQGIVVDDTKAELSGNWVASLLGGGIHEGYKHDEDARNGRAKAVFRAVLPEPGVYEVQVASPPNGNRAQNVTVVTTHAGGEAKQSLDQRAKPVIDGHFTSLGEWTFEKEGAVTITNEGANGFVVIDAVRWLPKK